MQQHIDFPIEISIIKFKAWPLMKTSLSKVAFLNDRNASLVVKSLRLPFRSVYLVGSGFLKA